MNILSAFSFGKIIKTFVPGVLALGMPVFGVDFVHFYYLDVVEVPDGIWRFYFQHSVLFSGELSSSQAAFLGLLLIPVALILGFFCNTLFWFFCHNRCWKLCEKKLGPEYALMRQRLEEIAKVAWVQFLGPTERVPGIYLPGFLLPALDFAKWNYVRESYFSWYEFNWNSLFAIWGSFLTYVSLWFYVACRWNLGGGWKPTLLAPCVVIVVVSLILVKSASRNLLVFRRRSLWFFLGTLFFSHPDDLPTRFRQLSLWQELSVSATKNRPQNKESDDEICGGD